MRFFPSPEVRGCSYLRGRNVLNACYDQLGAGSLLRLFASQSIHYQRCYCRPEGIQVIGPFSDVVEGSRLSSNEIDVAALLT